MPSTSLASQWQDFKESNPKVRIRDAAVQLKTTELELVATSCGNGNTRLKPNFKEILERLQSLGSVMGLLRSEHVVHETHGEFKEISAHGSVAMFFNPGMDTRFFVDKWFAVFAVNENNRHSLQFFTREGTAVYKVYVTEATTESAYFDLVESFTSDNQEPSEVLSAKAIDLEVNSSAKKEIDATSLRKSWLEIRDVHEGNRLIKQYGSKQRNAVYEALGEEYAQPLSVEQLEKALNIAAKKSIELMIFAMNDAAVQAYSGPVKKLMRTGPWFNVLDPEFNLHLRTDGIGKVWLINKPSNDGWVTTIDVLDKNGIEVMLIADNRMRGETESEQWQALCRKL
jgi:putative hemin transport protein